MGFQLTNLRLTLAPSKGQGHGHDNSTASIFEMVKDSRHITIGIKYEVTYMHLPYMDLTLPNS